jgi:hypothetical protein
LGLAQGNWGQGAAGIARVDTSLFDVLHNTANKQLLAIEDGIDVDLNRVV